MTHILVGDDGKRRPSRQRGDDDSERRPRIGKLAKLSHRESQRRTVLSPYQRYRGRAVQGAVEGGWLTGKGNDGGTAGTLGEQGYGTFPFSFWL